jgi:hypothetical protein
MRVLVEINATGLVRLSLYTADSCCLGHSSWKQVKQLLFEKSNLPTSSIPTVTIVSHNEYTGLNLLSFKSCMPVILTVF